MQDLAVIAKIERMSPIEGKDRIALAKVCNYDVVVSKSEFKEGDLCVYVLTDAILPESNPTFEFLRKRSYVPRCKGYRIRPMKLGGVVSEGIAFSTAILPPGSYKVGDSVAEALGVTKYDPESWAEASAKPIGKAKRGPLAKFLMRFKWYRDRVDSGDCGRSRGYPSWAAKADEENVEKAYGGYLTSGEKYRVTEKVEGMAASYFCEKNKFWACSHNRGVADGTWVEFADRVGLSGKMKSSLKSYRKANGVVGICLQGELCGPGIQGNIYGLKETDLFVYGGYWLFKGGRSERMTYASYEKLAEELGLKTVPFVRWWDKAPALDEALKEADGESLIAAGVPREGLVARTYEGDRHFKVKSREYKVWFSKRD